MNMNFGSDIKNQVKVAGDSNFLKGDAIYDVKLKEVKEEIVKSKDKDGVPGKEFKVLTLVFAEVNDEGVIDENSKEFHDKNFPLDEKAQERRVIKNNDGTEVQLPSSYETVMAKFQLYLENLCPKLYQQIVSGEKTIKATSWEEFKKVMLGIFSKVALSNEFNPTCKLKLVKKNNFASIPTFTKVSKEGNVYVSNSFFGNIEILEKRKREIAFSSYELDQIKLRQNAVKGATSTNQLMGGSTSTNATGSEALADINYEDINIDEIV